MGFLDHKIGNLRKPITALPIRITGQGEWLKRYFDGNAEQIRDAHDGLVDYINGSVYTKGETVEQINARIIAIGAGDMAKGVYDTDGDGKVNAAEYADTAAIADIAALAYGVKADTWLTDVLQADIAHPAAEINRTGLVQGTMPNAPVGLSVGVRQLFIDWSNQMTAVVFGMATDGSTVKAWVNHYYVNAWKGWYEVGERTKNTTYYYLGTLRLDAWVQVSGGYEQEIVVVPQNGAPALATDATMILGVNAGASRTTNRNWLRAFAKVAYSNFSIPAPNKIKVTTLNDKPSVDIPLMVEGRNP